jgi:hypothetical protein
MSKLRILETRLETFIDKILLDEPYTFSRYGDGEWKAIFRHPGANCDGHQYFSDMGEALERSILHPILHSRFWYALQGLSKRTMNFEISELASSTIQWLNADVFHKAFARGMMHHMILALKTKRVALIGPKYLSDCKQLRFLQREGHFIIPEKDCWTVRKEIQKYVLSNRKAEVFAFSASMATKAILYELFPAIGQDKWLIDFGSVWDPCAGKLTRQVHKTYSKELIERNLVG